MQATLRIFDAIKRLELKNGRDYTEKQIADIAKLHRHTVSVLVEGRIDTTLSKLLDFFASEGMPVTINDLFVIEDNPPPPTRQS